MTISNVWSNKEKLSKQARIHSDEMKTKYSNEIMESIQCTKQYGENSEFEGKSYEGVNTIISVEDKDSVSAIIDSAGEGIIAVLNFASYKQPGGMFLDGSSAQEESLCHKSYLFNVLFHFNSSYYFKNRLNLNRALYLDRALYTPDILFESEGKKALCDVITCAAPNKRSQKWAKVTEAENTEVLRSRVKFILNIAAENNVDTLILGAYGCGVFGQDANEVAQIFREFLESEFKQCFTKVVFAIPSGRSNRNYQIFKEAFTK